jgi:DnaK suppressor protein
MMAAKKSAPKSAKVKKPSTKASPSAAAKGASKKTAARKPSAKPAAAAPRKAPAPKPAPAVEKKTTPRVPTAPTAPTASNIRVFEPRRAANAPVEDGDSNENLLSGPRNVQAYVLKRGEQYMSKEQLDHFRFILQHWKQDLMLEVDRTVSHMKDEAANFPDPNDRATQEEEFSLELRTRDRERKLIRKIDEALARIEDGSYGYCLETGEPIGVKRLEARPVATLSLAALERRERREKQYGDRDDRYR